MLKTLLLLLQVTQHYLVMQPLQEAIQYGRFAALAPICQQRIVLNLEAPLALSGVMSKEQFIEEFAGRFSELRGGKDRMVVAAGRGGYRRAVAEPDPEKAFFRVQGLLQADPFHEIRPRPRRRQRERMETLLSPRLRNIDPRGLAAVLAAAILWLALFPAREMPLSEIRARVDKNCRRMEGILAKKVNECLRRSDSLAGAYAAGRLTAADLEKKEALIQEKNGIITDYVGEIFYFKPVALANGDWRLIKKNQDVYFLRRVDPQAYYVRFFMDIRSNPSRRSGGVSLSGIRPEILQPAPAARRATIFPMTGRKSGFITRASSSPARTSSSCPSCFPGRPWRSIPAALKKILVYGLGFLLSLLVFLALRPRRASPRGGPPAGPGRHGLLASGGRPPGGA